MKSHSIIFSCLLCLALFAACNEEDDSYRLNTRQVELNCRATQALHVTPALPGLSYTSLNTNIATVSAEGLITAKLVGTTKIVVKDSLNLFVDTVKVVVNSVNALFTIPYQGFGINHYKLLETLKITDYYFLYPPEGGFRVMFDSGGIRWGYTFSDENKLIYYYTFATKAQYSLLDLYLNDRYSYMITKRYSMDEIHSNVDTYYISPDSSLIVLDYRLSVNTSSIIEFFPATPEKIQLVLGDETYPDLR